MPTKAVPSLPRALIYRDSKHSISQPNIVERYSGEEILLSTIPSFMTCCWQDQSTTVDRPLYWDPMNYKTPLMAPALQKNGTQDAIVAGK